MHLSNHYKLITVWRRDGLMSKVVNEQPSRRMGTGSPSPKVRSDLLTTPVGQDLVVYDPSTNEAHRLNTIARQVWEMCDGLTSQDDIADTLNSLAGAHSLEHVARSLLMFTELGLLDSDSATPQPTRVARRDFLRKAALAGATVAAVPIIETILVPDAAAAASGAGPTPGPIPTSPPLNRIEGLHGPGPYFIRAPTGVAGVRG